MAKMQRKQITRTFEMTIETRERVVILGPPQTDSHWCVVCARRERFALLPDIAQDLGINQRQVFRMVESGDTGFSELPEGVLLVCTECMNKMATHP